MEVIKHDLDSVISGLGALQKTQLPYAAKRALFEASVVHLKIRSLCMLHIKRLGG